MRQVYGEVARPRAVEGFMSDQRVALVHDWLTGMRGGEKVLEVLCRLYPSADLLTLVHVPKQRVPGHRAACGRRASFLQRLPGIRRFYRYCLPLFPIAIEQFDLDTTISSSAPAIARRKPW